MLLHVHKGMTDGLQIKHIPNEFAVGDSVHCSVFAECWNVLMQSVFLITSGVFCTSIGQSKLKGF